MRDFPQILPTSSWGIQRLQQALPSPPAFPQLLAQPGPWRCPLAQWPWAMLGELGAEGCPKVPGAPTPCLAHSLPHFLGS